MTTTLSLEWQTLHQEHERYERYSLLIKLTATLSTALLFAFNVHIILGCVLIAVFWLQEGIWRTVQARTNARILVLEAALRDSNDLQAFQLYSNWQHTRPSTKGLIKEYLSNALRPTIAYPYIVLIAALGVVRILG